MLFLLLSSATALLFPAIIGVLLDTATSKQTAFLNDYFSAIKSWGINGVAWLLLGVLVLQAVFSFVRVLTFAYVSENVMADIRTDLYNKMIRLPISFFEKSRVGELTSRITADVTQLQEAISWTLGEFLRQIFTLIAGAVFIFLISTKLSLIMLSTFPILVVVAIFFGKYIKKMSKKTQDALAQANVVAEETLQNIYVVKSFSNEVYESNRYLKDMREVVSYAMKAANYRGIFTSFFIFGIFGGIILVLWFGASFIEQGVMTAGELTTFVIYTIYIGASLGGLSDLYSRLQKAVGASERVREILQETPEISLNKHIVPEDIPPIQGNIRFKEVSFHYPSRADMRVLNRIDMDIQSGQKIALVGSSGAGKSTIAQLLLRFYAINEGSIEIDGKSIYDYDLEVYRQFLGLVPQEVILFGGSIRENIAYGKPNASFEEIKTVAARANALDFIRSFPEGFDTVIGERGVKLSGGQRQRLAIARAMLRDPRILILDEATSSLDSESEQAVQQALDQLMKNRTSIIIAHRLSTIRHVDKIYVLEKGEICESGTHEELLANPQSRYKTLVALQQQYSSENNNNANILLKENSIL
ncbi:MAG: ATP-binding cassette domain-containing protein [Bacteroidetes bacterium]|nr:ATP-binding cassette domain-containing protein [Bacteroidota bacterium]MCB9043938.1 ATP-binding cassette domain-containing protein [Chitinophagales bacterium]